MSAPGRILVLEASALLSVLREFTDAHALEHHPERATRALEALLTSHGAHGPAVDRVVIPDHVLYEVTGVLPSCYPHMLRQLAAAKDDPAALAKVVDLYAFASPRGEAADRKGQQKRQIELLLRFIAAHPESLATTKTAATYGARLHADYAALSATGGAAIPQYRPGFADALQAIPDRFDPDGLRIHAGQMLMMGMIDEDEFKERLSIDEKAFGRKKRFYKAQGVVDRLEKEHGAAIGDRFFRELRAREGLAGAGATQVDFTFGMLRRHPRLLDPANAQPDAGLALRAIGPCGMLMEHYLFGGVLPQDAKAILTIAAALGFATQGLHDDGDTGKIRSELSRQGFFELSPTMQQLERVQQALAQGGHDVQTLGRLMEHIRSHELPQMKQFREACAAGAEGLPYEKVFSDALVSGWISWDEFWQLAGHEGMHRQYPGGYRGNERADILVQPGQGGQPQVLVAQEGFASRRGPVEMAYFTNPVTRVNVGGQGRPYVQFSPDELIGRCRAHLSNGRHVTHRLAPVFESMLYREVALDPVGLRQRAETLLGPERLLQMEKTFANRHARRVGQQKPPYADLFFALHTGSRIQRKNLGEVATLETARDLLAAHPKAHVWISNHDGDLLPTAPRGGDIALEPAVVRQHAGFMESVRQLNAEVAGKQQLHFLSTPRLLDDMHRLQGRTPPKLYEHLVKRQRSGYQTPGMVDAIAKFPNTSWDMLMRRALPADRQR